jgi:hypothetical protein
MKNNTQSVITIQENRNEPLKTLIIPDQCWECGFPNFNIWGIKQNQRLEITITCMKCGNPNQKIIHNGNTI